MPNRIFIDTLFVIALINPRDQYHSRANELAVKYDDSPFDVHFQQAGFEALMAVDGI